MIGCKRIFDMWMACYTQNEIAEAVGVTKETVSEICQKMAGFPKPDKAAAELETMRESLNKGGRPSKERKPREIITEVSKPDERRTDHKIAEAASRRVTITHMKNKAKRYAWSCMWSRNSRSIEQ